MKIRLLLIALFLPLRTFAQTPGIINYTQEDGLNATTTYGIAQDRDGFIWIGSDNGLFRFDGVEFKQYTQKDGLKNIDVLWPFPLADGTIMIAPFQNDFAMIKKGKVVDGSRFPDFKQIAPSKSRIITNSSEDKKTIAFFESVDPKKLVLYRNGHIQTYPIRFKSPDGKPYGVYCYDFKRSVYLSVAEKIIKYDLFSGKAVVVHNNAVQGAMASTMTDDQTLLSFYGKTVSIHRLPFKRYDKVFDSFVYWGLFTRPYLWIALADGGICAFELAKDPKLEHPILLMKDYIINGVQPDRDGNIWISSKNDGLFFLPRESFESLKVSHSESAAQITAIAADSSNIFLGYVNGYGGVYRNGKVKNFPVDPAHKFETRSILVNNGNVLYGQNWDIFQMRENWHFSPLKTRWPKNTVKYMAPYTEDEVLIGTHALVFSHNFPTGQDRVLMDENAYSLLAYGRDSIFAGNFKDLYKLNTKTLKRKLFLKGFYFTDLKKIGENRYIGATNGYGLIIFTNRGIIKRLGEEDGLANDQIKRIEVQNATTYWASTNTGLCRIHFDGKKLDVRNFTRNDGLPSDRVSGCVIRNDTVFAGTSKGMAILSIRKLLGQERFLNKKVIVNSVTIGGKNYYEPTQKLMTKFPDNTVVFNLSFLDYTSQGHINYRYKVEGLSSQWQTSNSSKIILNALPPGNYVFKVYGLGYNGKQSKTLSSVSFEVEPEFWQTWWFKAIGILGTMCVMIFTVHYFIQRRRDKKMRELLYEKKVAELELQAIKAQMNPHFVYNCLNSIQYLLYKKDYAETENYLDVFTQMIRKTLNYSEHTFATVREETDYLKLYLDMEKLRFKNRFRYEIKVGEGVNVEWKIPSLLIQPFVENAIKHGIGNIDDREGVITISFERFEGQLRILVRDNGSGIRDKSLMQKQGSFGMRLSQKRIDTFRQLFDVEITLDVVDLTLHGGHGTEIQLYLQLP